MPGYNFRMSNVLAALGIEQMKKLGKMNQARRNHAKYLINGLKDIPYLEMPIEAKGCVHTYQMFTIKLNKRINRNEFVKNLNDKGIGASVHFFPPIHRQDYYDDHPEWISGSLKVTEDVSKRIITLPLYPSLKKEELDTIIECVKSCLNEVNPLA